MQALEAQSSPDDHAMDCVDVEEAVDTLAQRRLQHSFLYSKAINARVCALLSLKTGVMVTVVTVNDLKDVSLRSTKLAGQFRAALAARRGAATGNTLAGPTVMNRRTHPVAGCTGGEPFSRFCQTVPDLRAHRFARYGLRRLLVSRTRPRSSWMMLIRPSTKCSGGCRRTLSSKLVCSYHFLVAAATFFPGGRLREAVLESWTGFSGRFALNYCLSTHLGLALWIAI